MRMTAKAGEKIVEFTKRVMGMADVMKRTIVAIFDGAETLVYPYDNYTQIVQDIKIKSLKAELAKAMAK